MQDKKIANVYNYWTTLDILGLLFLVKELKNGTDHQKRCPSLFF